MSGIFTQFMLNVFCKNTFRDIKEHNFNILK